MLLIGIILSLLSPNLRADCEVALKLCDEAVNALQADVVAKRELIDKQEELIKKLALQRNQAYDRLDDEIITPWYFWAVLGIAGGVILTRGLR